MIPEELFLMERIKESLSDQSTSLYIIEKEGNMEQAIKEKICQLLKSGNKEMCSLAITIFCGLTKQYSDYFDVRTAYGQGMFVGEDNARAAFNIMFNALDKSTIMAQHKKKMKEYRRTTLSSKQKRKQYKENFKKQKMLCAKTS